MIDARVTSENPFADPTRDSYIEFTQYLLPDGRKVSNPFLTTKEVAKMGADIIEAGYRFEVEILSFGAISATIVGKLPDSEEENDISGIVIANNPEVGQKLDKWIKNFHFKHFPGHYHG
jgi:hypothetical protein